MSLKRKVKSKTTEQARSINYEDNNQLPVFGNQRLKMVIVRIQEKPSFIGLFRLSMGLKNIFLS